MTSCMGTVGYELSSHNLNKMCFPFQAFGKIPVDAEALGVDYLTIAGHKFYGPRVGALYVRGLEDKTTPMYPLVLGGGQERGFRSG